MTATLEKPATETAGTPYYTRYVAGFMFNPGLWEVALIRKLKPVFQCGKLNAIGGKVEADETPHFAMVREFKEETGVDTTPAQWLWFMSLIDNKVDERRLQVDFFVTTGPVKSLRSMEQETVETLMVAEINPLRTDLVDEVSWLIPLAIHCLRDGRPGMVRAFL